MGRLGLCGNELNEKKKKAEICCQTFCLLENYVRRANFGKTRARIGYSFRWRRFPVITWKWHRRRSKELGKRFDIVVCRYVWENFYFPQMNERLDDKTCYSAIKIEAIETECDSRKKRSFQCYMCSKAYTTKQMLKLHISSIHMLLRPFKCELCSRAFYDKYTLTTHARIHSGERPYACPFCDKTFVQHSAMTKHKRVHTKEKPFQCEICSKSFSDRSSLIPHRKIHTGESERNRSFRCDVCDAGFIKNSHLVRHNQTKSHLKRVLECKIDVSEADYDASIYC